MLTTLFNKLLQSLFRLAGISDKNFFFLNKNLGNIFDVRPGSNVQNVDTFHETCLYTQVIYEAKPITFLCIKMITKNKQKVKKKRRKRNKSEYVRTCHKKNIYIRPVADILAAP